VFFNVFSPPNHDPDVQFPPKNLVLVLANLSSFAVLHCTSGNDTEESALSVDSSDDRKRSNAARASVVAL